MTCCRENQEPVISTPLPVNAPQPLPPVNAIPNLSGELKIFNGVGPDQTIPLNEQEVWMVRTALKETLKRALNEHGYVNGEAKALLIEMVKKIDPLDLAPGGCGEYGQCECTH